MTLSGYRPSATLGSHSFQNATSLNHSKKYSEVVFVSKISPLGGEKKSSLCLCYIYKSNTLAILSEPHWRGKDEQFIGLFLKLALQVS